MNSAYGFCPTELKAIKKAKLSPVGTYTAKKLFAYNEKNPSLFELYNYSKYTFISRKEQVAIPRENFNLTIHFSRAKKAAERED